MNGNQPDPQLTEIIEAYAQLCAVLDFQEKMDAFTRTLIEIRSLPEAKS